MIEIPMMQIFMMISYLEVSILVMLRSLQKSAHALVMVLGGELFGEFCHIHG
jgi:hypothetical protein